MYQSPVKYLLIILFIIGGTRLAAQPTSGATTAASTTDNSSNPLTGRLNNPYSKYGIGELLNGNSTVLKGMGNATSAFENPFELNTDNPASYAFLQRTTFEFGMTAETRGINGGGLSYRTGTATINYFSLGIPVNENSGICVGFKPVSRSFYNLADTINNSPIGQIANSYTGDGGLNYAYIGGAYKYKGLSIGANVGYLFGTLQSTTAVVPIDSTAINRAYTAEYQNYTRIGGLYGKAGVLYKTKIDSGLTLHLGGTFTMKQMIRERFSTFQVSSFNFGDTLVSDTITKLVDQRGKLTMPMSFSVGAMLTKNDKWSLAIDYTTTKWSGYNSSPDISMNQGVGNNSYKISLGGEYTPDVNSIRNYYSKITYRCGFYYGTDYLTLDGTTLPVYGMTLGASLPFRRSRFSAADFGTLHLMLDGGRLGTQTNGLIQQTYFRLGLGISFNSKWFIPRKYD